MKTFLLSLCLLGTALPSAFGQTPWVAMPNAPVYNPGAIFSPAGFGASNFLVAPQPNVLWGKTSNSYSQSMPGVRYTSYTIFCTTDGGQTWQTLRSTYSYGLHATGGDVLNGLSALDGQRAWLVKYDSGLNLSTLLRTTSGMSGFVTVAGALPQSVENIHFFSATVGVGIGRPAPGASTWPLYRTTDGGDTWTLVANTPTVLNNNDYVLSKHNYGTSLWLTTSNSTVLQTADAGLTWTETTNLGKVVFSDALHGLAYSGASTLRRTTDGGATWNTFSPSATTTSWGAITAVPGVPASYVSSGYNQVGGVYTFIVSASHDGGTTWQELSAAGNDSPECMAADAGGQLWGTVESSHGTAMVLRYGSTLLAAKQPLAQAPVLAYPNPSTGMVTVGGPLAGEEQVRIYDAAGRLCQQGRVSGTQRTLDLSAQAPGLYQLVLTAADGSVRHQRLSKL